MSLPSAILVRVRCQLCTPYRYSAVWILLIEGYRLHTGKSRSLSKCLSLFQPSYNTNLSTRILETSLKNCLDVYLHAPEGNEGHGSFQPSCNTRSPAGTPLHFHIQTEAIFTAVIAHFRVTISISQKSWTHICSSYSLYMVLCTSSCYCVVLIAFSVRYLYLYYLRCTVCVILILRHELCVLFCLYMVPCAVVIFVVLNVLFLCGS